MKELKTNKQYERDKKKCKFCHSTGIDVFDKSKPCPNCSKNKIIIIK